MRDWLLASWRCNLIAFLFSMEHAQPTRYYCTPRPHPPTFAHPYCALPKDTEAFGSHKYITTDGDTGCYFRPDTGNKLLVGSLEPACDNLEYLDTPEHMNLSLTDNWTNYVYARIARIAPSCLCLQISPIAASCPCK